MTIDGVKLIGDAAGSLGNTAVEVQANNFSLVNSILDGDGDVAIIIQSVTGLEHRQQSDHRAIRSAPMSPAATPPARSTTTVFQGDGGPITGLGNGVNSESSHVSIANNVFDGIYAGTLNLFRSVRPTRSTSRATSSATRSPTAASPARSRSIRPTQPTTSSAPTITRRSTATLAAGTTASPERSASTAAAATTISTARARATRSPAAPATTSSSARAATTRLSGGSGDDSDRRRRGHRHRDRRNRARSSPTTAPAGP